MHLITLVRDNGMAFVTFGLGVHDLHADSMDAVAHRVLEDCTMRMAERGLRMGTVCRADSKRESRAMPVIHASAAPLEIPSQSADFVIAMRDDTGTPRVAEAGPTWMVIACLSRVGNACATWYGDCLRGASFDGAPGNACQRLAGKPSSSLVGARIDAEDRRDP